MISITTAQDPNIASTRLKSKAPTSPQLIPPISNRTNAILCNRHIFPCIIGVGYELYMQYNRTYELTKNGEHNMRGILSYMPEKKTRSNKTKAVSKISKKLQEIQEQITDIQNTLEEMHFSIDKMRPPTAWKRAVHSFGKGIVQALGFLFGTTIIAALLFFILQKTIANDKVQAWMNERATTFINNSLSNFSDQHIDPLPNVDLPFFNE